MHAYSFSWALPAAESLLPWGKCTVQSLSSHTSSALTARQKHRCAFQQHDIWVLRPYFWVPSRKGL